MTECTVTATMVGDPKPTEQFSGEEKCYRQDLVYMGVDGTKIRFAYREYDNNLIRDKFNAEVSFDIATDKTLAWRDTRLLVKSVSNSGIVAQVVSGPPESYGPSRRVSF
jgi:hypothetical protein